jgi:hypothetical protein
MFQTILKCGLHKTLMGIWGYGGRRDMNICHVNHHGCVRIIGIIDISQITNYQLQITNYRWVKTKKG